MKLEFIYMDLVAPSFILLPVVTGLLKFTGLPKEAKILIFYLVIDMLVSIASSALALNNLNNTPLYHFATVISGMILLYFFSAIFYQQPFKKFIILLIWLLPILGILNAIFFQPFNSFNSYTFSLQHIIIIALCFLYWWFNENDTGKSWASFPLNWIISGILLYFSSAFIIFTFSNLIITSLAKNISILLWNIHATLTILMHLLISIGFSKYKK
jgi:hypothetical protein